MIFKNYFSIQRILRPIGVFSLLLSVLLLPMLHLHPAYDHVHGDAEGHQHQPAVHADFFPDTTHGHEHHNDQGQHDQDHELPVGTSFHSHSQIDLLSLHIGQSFQFSSVFKKSPLALGQDSLDLSIFPYFQRGAFHHQHALPRQTIQFSPTSLRAPPYFA